jgi:hypothetical protein
VKLLMFLVVKLVASVLQPRLVDDNGLYNDQSYVKN